MSERRAGRGELGVDEAPVEEGSGERRVVPPEEVEGERPGSGAPPAPPGQGGHWHRIGRRLELGEGEPSEGCAGDEDLDQGRQSQVDREALTPREGRASRPSCPYGSLCEGECGGTWEHPGLEDLDRFAGREGRAS